MTGLTKRKAAVLMNTCYQVQQPESRFFPWDFLYGTFFLPFPEQTLNITRQRLKAQRSHPFWVASQGTGSQEDVGGWSKADRAAHPPCWHNWREILYGLTFTPLPLLCCIPVAPRAPPTPGLSDEKFFCGYFTKNATIKSSHPNRACGTQGRKFWQKCRNINLSFWDCFFATAVWSCSEINGWCIPWFSHTPLLSSWNRKEPALPVANFYTISFRSDFSLNCLPD